MDMESHFSNPAESSMSAAQSRELLLMLVQRFDELCDEHKALRRQVDQLQSEIARLSANMATQNDWSGETLPFDEWGSENLQSRTLDKAADSDALSVIQGDISDYEAGMLFDEAAFDLTIRFQRLPGKELAKQWGFEDAGHLLLALLEACTKIQMETSSLEEFTFRRDIDSATVYATNRSALEQLLKRMDEIGMSQASTMTFIRQLEPESRKRF